MQIHRKTVLSFVMALLISTVCQAKFMHPEIKNVPVARLIANIEAKLKDDPTNVELTFTLARIHSMAFARKATELPTRKGKETLWNGFVPKGIPYDVVTSDDKEVIARAKAHLEKAIALHTKVLELKPDHTLARLGLAWCTQQAGKKDEAIKLYRALIKDALPEDRKLSGRYRGLPTVSTEASHYLISLLDPVKDADEIAKLKKQSEKTEKGIPRMITPVAIALKGSLLEDEFIDTAATVSFDLDGSGIQRQWQWINPDTAWLVYDNGATGKITSALQMFGNVTFWCFWENGYQAMASLDDNADGSLRGEELQHLALWQDRNQDGISDAGEVKPLADFGIVELACGYEPTPSGMLYNSVGAIFKDGTIRPSCDVVLNEKPVAK